MFSPDRRRILTCCDETARLWDGDGRPLATLGDSPGPIITDAKFSSDRGRILTQSFDGAVRLWDSDGRPAATFQGQGSYLATSPDGGRILTAPTLSAIIAAHDTTARLWDGDGQPLATLEGHTSQIRWALFSPAAF
jgi:WD40 repeat protein